MIFLILGRPASDECAAALEKLLRIFGRLGLPVAQGKLEGPTTQLEFLGFELNSDEMVVRLPQRKLTELRALLRQWQGKKQCRRRELESLVGKLAHASRVVIPGRTFTRRMFELLGGIRQGHHRVRLNESFRSDLLWWLTFMEDWNGMSLIREPTGAHQSAHIWTDASGLFGCGAVDPAERAWFQFPWPPEYERGCLQLREESITVKEMLPIVLACALWGNRWWNNRVTVHCDNLGVVALLSSGYSRVPPIMHMVRSLFFIRAHFQLDVIATHVPGVENTLADAISRNNLPLLFAQMPGSAGNRTEIPADLLSLLVERQPDWTSPTWTRLFRSCIPQV